MNTDLITDKINALLEDVRVHGTPHQYIFLLGRVVKNAHFALQEFAISRSDRVEKLHEDDDA